LQNLILKYDWDRDGYLSFSDFSNAVIPRTRDYYNLINAWVPIDLYLIDWYLDRAFSLETIDAIWWMLNIMIEAVWK